MRVWIGNLYNMAFLEKNMQSLVTRWAKDNWRKEMGDKSALIELKITKTKTLPFSKIAPHQYTSLLKAKTGTLVHKLSDSAIGFLPADMFVLARSSAYLCVMFYVPRKPKIIYLLDILDLLQLKEIPKKRSLRESDCIEFGKAITL